MELTRRTDAGKLLETVMRSGAAGPELPGSFTEGARDSAWVIVQTEDGRHFQVHIAELHFTERELAFYAGQHVAAQP